jgi:hypothetical protein
VRSLLANAVFGLVLLPAAAHAGSIAVVTDTADGPLPDSTFRSVVWHALYAELGHDAEFMDALDASAVTRMQGTTMTTLLHLELQWRADSARVDRSDGEVFLVGGHYPVVQATEYTLEGDRLVARYTWRTEGPISVYHVRGDDPYRYISLPEVTLQETATLAVQPTRAPVWTAEPDLVRVPIIVAGDDEYRAFYGASTWSEVSERAVARANAILRSSGLRLDVVGHQSWESPDDVEDLSELLEAMSNEPIGVEGALRVGFTGQTRLAVEWQSEMEDVGRAYLPGRDVLIADQAANPGQDAAWDVAEEGVAVAHEVMHALGIPHLDEPDHLMSATKRGTVHALHPSTRDLARVAAATRYTHWDRIAALTGLSLAAEAHLTDLDLQLDYIADNLAYGPGMPAPGTLQPGELSALTNVAVGRAYLRLAAEDPDHAEELKAGAKVHAESALAQKPLWVEARQLQRQIAAASRAAAPRVPKPEAPAPGPSLDELAERLYGGAETCRLEDREPTCE